MAAGKVRAWSNSHARFNFFLFSPDRETNKNGEGKETRKRRGKRRGRVTLSRRRESLSRKRSFPVNKRGINAAIWSSSLFSPALIDCKLGDKRL